MSIVTTKGYNYYIWFDNIAPEQFAALEAS